MQTHAQAIIRDAVAARAVAARLPRTRHAHIVPMPVLIPADEIGTAFADDSFTFAAVVCDSAGRIMSMNPAASRLAQARLGLSLNSQSGLIGAESPDDRERLAALIRAACVDGSNGKLVLRNSDRMPSLIVKISSTPSKSAFGPGHALVAIRDLNASSHFCARDLIDLFRLSPAQASLAVNIYNGLSFEEIAVQCRVKVSTLRTHFAEVLHRTGAANLRDLVRRLGMIP